MGPRPGVRYRRLRRQAGDGVAGDPRRTAGLLLPHCRCGVHAHPGPRAAGLAAGSGGEAGGQAGARRAAAHPGAAQCRGGVRGLPADEVRRAEAVLAGGRGVLDPAAGRRTDRGRSCRAGRGGHRDAAPRPAERAGQHRREELRPGLPRVRGQHRPAHGARLRRREVPPGLGGHLHRRGRCQGLGVAGVQPEPPRGGRPGTRGHRAGQAGRHQQRRAGLQRAAGTHARRRGLRRPGRGGRDAEPVPASRLPHRRHCARRRQQPGRVHHRTDRRPLQRLRHRCRPDDPGTDLPCER